MKKAILLVFGCTVLLALSGCGLMIMVLAERGAQPRKPGALDPVISVKPHYVKHTFAFLGKYRVSHEWPNFSISCAYGGYLGKPAGVKLRFFDSLSSIYEENGKLWIQADESYADKKPNGEYWPANFDTYVRSVKIQQPIYQPIYTEQTYEEMEASEKMWKEDRERSRKTGKLFRTPIPIPPETRKPIGYEEIETGLRPVCFASWYVTSRFLRVGLQKRSLQEWKNLIDTSLPPGKWSVQPVAGNNWAVRELQENELLTRPRNGVGGPHQYWLLPIGDTGYTILLELGTSKESLQYPEAYEQLNAIFHHLIESVKIEPLQP